MFPLPSGHRRPWPRRRPPHARLFLDAAGQLANNPSIQGEDWRVLLLLLSLVDGKNRAVVRTAELTGHLKMPRQSVCRAITKLIKIGIVWREPQGTPGLYQVSEHLASRHLVTSEDRPQCSYVRVWQTDALRDLAADRALHSSDFRVLGKVLAGMQWCNIVYAPTVLWSQELGMARQTIWRSLQVLMAKGVLFSDFRGRPDHYELSFRYGYRGYMRYLAMLRRQEQAIQQLEAMARQ